MRAPDGRNHHRRAAEAAGFLVLLLLGIVLAVALVHAIEWAFSAALQTYPWVR